MISSTIECDILDILFCANDDLTIIFICANNKFSLVLNYTIDHLGPKFSVVFLCANDYSYSFPAILNLLGNFPSFPFAPTTTVPSSSLAPSSQIGSTIAV